MNSIFYFLDGNEQLHVQSIPGVYFRQFEPSAKEVITFFHYPKIHK